jgi:hypothetical protein
MHARVQIKPVPRKTTQIIFFHGIDRASFLLQKLLTEKADHRAALATIPVLFRYYHPN